MVLILLMVLMVLMLPIVLIPPMLSGMLFWR